ncbi:DNA gyrase/topoisomerase IV subunit A [Poriferisphaera corsica]|uniref:DNA gyrase/topoisomerase IV subunit A n=1 Tax=Poriferisphaera corsica TaxID=2528020 RepID=UPI0011A95661|nr:DNA topoisomerase IV subunit A [Poriferisphaera corsica]
MAKRKSSSRRKSKSSDEGLLFGGGASEEGGGLKASEEQVSLHEAAQKRYLNYALSVITSRALPDVRDGFKPVQRRIGFTMWQQRLTHEAKFRKSAKVVGDVMGNYHPHGDSSIYDALVRMAQPFAMRLPMVDGSGNFGSLDGDPAAAMRYTECRMTAAAVEMLNEIGQNTVTFRPNYDGTKSEPVVLPAKLPNLLLNGATGIAVGMATSIPPHNLSELCKALIRLIDDPELTSAQLARTVKGPDFPTGGQIINNREELTQIYKTGSGTVRTRGTWEAGPATRTVKKLYITSIPYMVNKSTLVERIADVVISRKMPLLLDVRDVSTDDIRIELDLKKDADENKVLAYLYKNTPLQSNFSVNLTCLVPTDNPEVCAPDRLDLRSILRYFLNFRLEVVTRRLEHELNALNKRIHILEGFMTVFDALDEIIRIIRKSEGKADAASKIIKKFKLDEEQTDAILELKLYRLARLEILVIQDELKAKKKRANEIKKLLNDETANGRWKIVRGEVEEMEQRFGKTDKRRSLIASVDDEPEFSEEDFIVAEEANVLITTDGWVKRQKEIKDPANTRLREGDSVLACVAGSTRNTVVFFSNLGTAYTARVLDIPATTGYGEPIQKLFKLKDGEKIVAAYSLDPRALGTDKKFSDVKLNEKSGLEWPLQHLLAVTSDGYALRISIENYIEPSTKAGRKFARPAKGSRVVGVELVTTKPRTKTKLLETILAVSANCRAMICKAEDVNFLSGPGKGVQLIKLAKDDQIVGFKASTGDRDLLRVKTNRGAEKTISTAKYKTTSRGGKGTEIQKHGKITSVIPEEPAPPLLIEDE